MAGHETASHAANLRNVVDFNERVLFKILLNLLWS